MLEMGLQAAAVFTFSFYKIVILTCLNLVTVRCAGVSCDPLTLCIDDGCGSCPSGYTGTGDTQCQGILIRSPLLLFIKFHVLDINECDQGVCDPIVQCTNLPGNYSCDPCPIGYSGTGYTHCDCKLIFYSLFHFPRQK